MTNKSIIIAILLLMAGQMVYSQQADNYRGRLRNRFVKVDNTNLPIATLISSPR